VSATTDLGRVRQRAGVRGFLRLLTAEPFTAALGALLAKATALDLLPLEPLAGGRALRETVWGSWRQPDDFDAHQTTDRHAMLRSFCDLGYSPQRSATLGVPAQASLQDAQTAHSYTANSIPRGSLPPGWAAKYAVVQSPCEVPTRHQAMATAATWHAGSEVMAAEEEHVSVPPAQLAGRVQPWALRSWHPQMDPLTQAPQASVASVRPGSWHAGESAAQTGAEEPASSGSSTTTFPPQARRAQIMGRSPKRGQRKGSTRAP
jgi:hypothetical protein